MYFTPSNGTIGTLFNVTFCAATPAYDSRGGSCIGWRVCAVFNDTMLNCVNVWETDMDPGGFWYNITSLTRTFYEVNGYPFIEQISNTGSALLSHYSETYGMVEVSDGSYGGQWSSGFNGTLFTAEFEITASPSSGQTLSCNIDPNFATQQVSGLGMNDAVSTYFEDTYGSYITPLNLGSPCNYTNNPSWVSITPLSASANTGQSLTFNSTVTGGTFPYNYQWYLNGIPVAGATSTSWSFTPAASGAYYILVNVTDSAGDTAQSQTAIVTAGQYNINFSETGIGSNFNGIILTVDGSGYTATELPLSFWWDSNSTHTFAFQSPLVVNGNTTEQYDWTSTSALPTLQLNTINETGNQSILQSNPLNATSNQPTLQSGAFNVTGPQSVTGNYVSQSAVTINRVQGYCQGTTTGNTLTVNMTNTPSIGDVLIAIISTVTDTGFPASPNITEANVFWREAAGGGGGGTAPGEHGYYMGLWIGKVGAQFISNTTENSGAEPSRTIKVELGAAADLGATIDVCEYSGIANVDQSTPNGLQSETTTLSTGTVGVNTMNGELAVAGIVDEGYPLSNATNGFTLLDGNYINNQSLAYLEKTNCPIGEENSTITVPGITNGYGCIATFRPTLIESNVTITNQVTANGVLNFTASGPTGQTGSVNVTVPVGFNSTDITAFIDGQQVQQPIITTDGFNYFVYLAFHLSTHNIIIQYAGAPSTLNPSPSPTPQPTTTPSPSPTPQQQTGFLGTGLSMEYGYAIIAAVVFLAVLAVVAFAIRRRK